MARRGGRSTDLAEAELDRLHRAGFRGVRVNLFAKSGLVLDDLEAIAARVSAFKWHVQLHADARTLPERITNFCRSCQPGGLIKGM